MNNAYNGNIYQPSHYIVVYINSVMSAFTSNIAISKEGLPTIPWKKQNYTYAFDEKGLCCTSPQYISKAVKHFTTKFVK